MIAFVRRKVTESAIDTSISFVVPYLAYLPAEHYQGSGVLAVVVAGLLLGHKSPIIQNASSRVSERINWTTIQFILENVVFLMLGMQMHRLVDDANETGLGWGRVIGVCRGRPGDRGAAATGLGVPVQVAAGQVHPGRGEVPPDGGRGHLLGRDARRGDPCRRVHPARGDPGTLHPRAGRHDGDGGDPAHARALAAVARPDPGRARARPARGRPPGGDHPAGVRRGRPQGPRGARRRRATTSSRRCASAPRTAPTSSGSGSGRVGPTRSRRRARPTAGCG